MAQFFNDLFSTAVAGNITAHTSDSGHAWVVAMGAPEPRVFTIGVVGVGGLGNVIIRPAVASPTADAKTLVAFHYDSTGFVATGPCVRMSADGSSGYLAAYSKASSSWAFFRLTPSLEAAKGTPLAQTGAITYVQGNDAAVEFSAEGSGATVTLTLKINGATVLTFADTDVQRVTAAGYPGLYMQGTSASAGTGIWYDSMSADTIVAAAATVPPAPTIGTISAGDGTVTVPYTSNGDGGSPITSATATWSGGQSATGTGNPLVITGVTNGTAGTARVKLTNAIGPGPESVASNSVTPSAAVTVSGVAVSPATANVTGGTTQQFSAIVNGTGAVPQGVTWSVTGTGTISASGVYSAPAATNAAQSVTIHATSTADATKSGTAVVTIPAAVAVTVTSVTVSPPAPTVSGGTVQQFTATVNGTGVVPQSVTWVASLGSITAAGVYTAPASTDSAQTATITATSTQDPTKSGSTAATIPATIVVGAQIYSTERNLRYEVRVQDTTSTTGPGNVVLANAAPQGMRTFGASYPIGAKDIPYCIEDDATGAWEYGSGTLLTATTFSRDKVFSSSAAGAKIDFAAGIKDIFVVVPARAFSTFAVKDYIDLRDFDVDPTFTNDSTAGIQAAIMAAFNRNISRIKCPDGRFKVAGPRNVSNAQLYIPNSRSNDPSRTILFEGAAPPNQEMQGLVSMPVPTNGTIFESTIVGNANSFLIRGERGVSGDVSGMRWNYTNIGFRNMGFRTKVDTGANPMSAVGLDYFSQIVEFDNIRVDVNTPIISCPNPSLVNSSGVIIPPINNHAQFNIGTVLIAGYTNGIVFGEHTHAKSIIVLGCVNAVVLPDANHGSMIGHLLVECSKNSILMKDNHPLAITAYSTEHNTDGNWFDFESDIKYTATNTTTRKVVILQSTVVKSHVGIDDPGFTTNNPACYKVIVGAGAN